MPSEFAFQDRETPRGENGSRVKQFLGQSCLNGFHAVAIECTEMPCSYLAVRQAYLTAMINHQVNHLTQAPVDERYAKYCWKKAGH